MAIPDDIVLVAIIYLRQIFVFCNLINKNVFEWFLLTKCEEHTADLQSFLVETIPNYAFD